jgi:long-chain acyl-CoA synthetase
MSQHIPGTLDPSVLEFDPLFPIDPSGRRPIATVNELFLRIAGSKRPDTLRWQDETGQWNSISSSAIYQRVRALAKAFLNWGIQRGDRIGLLSENRWEWAITDFATLAIGAVDVPVYPTLTPGQIGELILDSGCRIMVVSTRAQYDKIAAAQAALPEGLGLEQVIMMDSANLSPDAISFASLLHGADELGSQRDAEFDALVASIRPTELATLIYTSGTTGEPKGVMLTHGNIATNSSVSTREYNFGPADSCVSFLPLSHITARALDYAMFFYGAQVAYCSQFDKLLASIKQIRPTVFVGVPRVYEKIRQGVELKSSASKIKAGILSWAVKTGAAGIHAVYDGEQPTFLTWKLANKLVYSKIREAFGGRVKAFISGGAPLGVDTQTWFASVGIAVYEGYGLTETSPVIAINSPSVHRMGSVGKPLFNVECKLAADDELLVRGPSIFQGYWKKPEASKEIFDAAGWFSTGDIAKIDPAGFLFITDRKKELLKTWSVRQCSLETSTNSPR